MKCSVEINFKKGPSFTATEIMASCEEAAKSKALNYARQSGFYQAIKKITVRKS